MFFFVFKLGGNVATKKYQMKNLQENRVSHRNRIHVYDVRVYQQCTNQVIYNFISSNMW